MILVLAGIATGCLASTELPPDAIPPQVQITDPDDSSTVGGGVLIEVDAADNFSVEVVRVLIDGTLRATFYARPYKLVWSTIPLANNSVHAIRAEAVDPSGNVGSAQISVTVFNQKD
ncbi:MAG: Ig-like domain-containing protein [Gemmatimonadales bacterium]